MGRQVGRDRDPRVEEARAVTIGEAASLCGLGIGGAGRNRYSGPCPECGGKDRFWVDTRGAGKFGCNQCGLRGVRHDAIGLVSRVRGATFVEAVSFLVGDDPPASPERAAREARRRAEQSERDAREARVAEDAAARAQRIWDGAVPIEGTPGWGYMAGRGIDLGDAPDHGGLRWHPLCPWERGYAPCVVARFTDAVTGEPRGVWRRPVDGQKPKTLGPCRGCVVRLWPQSSVGRVLVVGEGVETVLAAATRVVYHGMALRPAWATGGTSGIVGMPVLPGIEDLVVLVDHDASGAGEQAAWRCLRKWEAEGRRVTTLMPPAPGTDFNDFVRTTR